MYFDSLKRFTPRRAVTKRGSLAVTFTDRLPILIELEMPKSEESREKVKLTWNTKKPGAWEKYKEESNKVAEKIELIAEDEGFGEEELMEKIDKIQTKVKFATFGKTRPQTNKRAKQTEAGEDGSETVDAKELLKRQ